MIQALVQELKHINGTEKDFRSFGLIVGGICVALSFLFSDTAGRLWLLGVVLIAAGALFPQTLSVLYRVWMGLAVVLGFFVSRTLFIVLFYGVILPIGFLMRLFSGDPLKRAIEKDAPTYWVPSEKKADPKNQLEQLF